MRETFLPFCKAPISEADIQAVVAVLRSGWITTGPKVAELERAIATRCGAKEAVAATSATALDQRQSDELISRAIENRVER